MCLLRKFVGSIRCKHTAVALIFVIDAKERLGRITRTLFYQTAGCAAPPNGPSPVGGKEQDAYGEDVIGGDAVKSVAEVDGGDGV